MIEVVFTTLKEMNTSKYTHYLSLMPETLRDEILKYRVKEDRYRTLLGKILVLNYFEKNTQFDLSSLKKTSYHRPYIDNSEIDFNISHSQSYVVSAFAKNNAIGIDIEEINKEINIDAFKDVFRESEFKEIHNASNPIEYFYKLWTIKEAVLKAIGRGFIDNPKEVIISEESASYKGKVYHILSFEKEGYICSLAFLKKAKVVIRTEI